MKTILRFGILMVWCIGMKYPCAAHALWIETNPKGSMGEKHVVNIFYGEFADGIKEDTSQWYSDVENFTIWLVDAQNQKITLPTIGLKNRYQTEFIPSHQGVYTLYIQHSTKDFPNTTRLEFIALAQVVVGSSKVSNPSPLASTNLSISLHPYSIFKKNKRFPLVAKGLGMSPTDIKVEIASETGWAKRFIPDTSGLVPFVPLWKGKYLVEAIHSQAEEGLYHGKNTKAIWRKATYMIYVK